MKTALTASSLEACWVAMSSNYFVVFDWSWPSSWTRVWQLVLHQLGELMALLRESLNVIPEGFTQLLPATLQILGVARSHVCALEVVGEYLIEIILAINRVSR
jgi:hypothetical protein